MAKVKYTMRFYRAHDLDLITFIETRQFNIMHAVYSALTAFANGEAFVIEIPPERNVAGEYQRIYSRILVLDSEKDSKAIKLMSTVAPGYRNSFLKNLVRLYLCCPFSEDYFASAEDSDYAFSLTSIFRENRRVAQAGTIRSVKRPRQNRKRKDNAGTDTSNLFSKKSAGDSVPARVAVRPDDLFDILQNDDSKEGNTGETEKEVRTDNDDINSIFTGIMDSM